MKVLIAEDDDDHAMILESFVAKLGHEVVVCHDGASALARFKNDEYSLVITDWMMPGVTGPQLCESIRGLSRTQYTYIILMTALQEKSRYIEGLTAGADDFIRKPVDHPELAARITVAERIQRLHDHVTQLEGILSICSECKKIRNDDGEWLGVETYMAGRTALSFSHGLCPGCLQRTREAWARARSAPSGRQAS